MGKCDFIFFFISFSFFLFRVFLLLSLSLSLLLCHLRPKFDSIRSYTVHCVPSFFRLKFLKSTFNLNLMNGSLPQNAIYKLDNWIWHGKSGQKLFALTTTLKSVNRVFFFLFWRKNKDEHALRSISFPNKPAPEQTRFSIIHWLRLNLIQLKLCRPKKTKFR